MTAHQFIAFGLIITKSGNVTFRQTGLRDAQKRKWVREGDVAIGTKRTVASAVAEVCNPIEDMPKSNPGDTLSWPSVVMLLLIASQL